MHAGIEILIIKLEADGNSSAFGADGADVSLIAKMSGSFLRQSEQTSQHTHTRNLFAEGRLFGIQRHVLKCASKTQALIKVCQGEKKKNIRIFRASLIIANILNLFLKFQYFTKLKILLLNLLLRIKAMLPSETHT